MNFSQLKQYLFNNLWYGENGTPVKDRQTVTGLLVAPPTGKVWGIDISHWNRPPVDLKRMRELYGLSFVIIKGHDGSLKSRYFDEHVAAAKLAGIPWGIYDWLYPSNRVNIEAQTTAWANQYVSDPPPMGIFIDAEWTTYAGQAANPSAADLRAAHNSLKGKINRVSGTYTAKGYADQYLRGYDWSREPLWVARYGASPLLPSGATTYQLWQFTSTLDGKALDPNGNAELDGNYYNGTPAQFAAEFGGSVSEPPTGGTMSFFQATGSQVIRTAGNNTAPLGVLGGTTQYILGPMSGSGSYGGDVVECEAPIGGYMKIKRLWRNGAWTQLPPAAYCSTNHLKSITFTPPADPANNDLSQLTVNGAVSLTIEGVSYTSGPVTLSKV